MFLTFLLHPKLSFWLDHKLEKPLKQNYISNNLDSLFFIFKIVESIVLWFFVKCEKGSEPKEPSANGNYFFLGFDEKINLCFHLFMSLFNQ